MCLPPTIVVFPGAWHTTKCLDKLQSILQVKYKVLCFGLRSAGSGYVNNNADAAYMRHEVLEPLFNDGHEVILLVHSWAGIVASEAIGGLHRNTRRNQNLPGGLVGLIYVAGLTQTNEFETREAKLAALPSFVRFNVEADVSFITSGRQVFYNDVDEAEALKMEELLVPHSLSASLSHLRVFGYKDRPFDRCRGYIRCLRDQAVPLQYQDLMLEQSGVEWSVKTIDAGHSPFVSKPEEMARIVVELVDSFTSA